MHVVRDPMEMLTRSYLASEPNATHTLNASALVAGFEAHIKTLLGEELHDMQAISEGHSADPNYLQVRMEDLNTADVTRRNATLTNLFAFLLGRPEGNLATATPFPPPSVWTALMKAHKSEEIGSSQRKHLAGLLLRKPAKCHHVSKLQAALKYPTVTCASSRKRRRRRR